MQVQKSSMHCRKCGRSLQNVKSIENGMGPICAHKHPFTEGEFMQVTLGQFDPRVLDPTIAILFTDQITRHTCRVCQTSLDAEPVMHYEHDGGWHVPGMDKKQWLFITCPRCQNQWSLWKLGVTRDA